MSLSTFAFSASPAGGVTAAAGGEDDAWTLGLEDDGPGGRTRLIVNRR